MRLQQGLSALLAVSALSALMGCATARLTRFNTFAQAGTMYVTASQAVIQDAGTAAINTDSALLVKYRPDLDQSQRTKRVLQSDTLLKERLRVLQLISAHGKLLQAYFQALAALSDPKAPNTAGTAAEGVYDSLAKMSPALKNAKMGSTSVSSFIPAVTAPIVATFKVHALNEELKARSDAIANELALQQAAFSAIEAELKTDTQELQNFRETDNVNQFAANAPLPDDWASKRLALLTTPSSVASAEAASHAAAKLRSTFTALVENRVDSADFAGLTSDISNILTVAQGIQPAAK